jgi:hypothetical protein
MSSPRQSLATRVPWSKLASELEIHLRTVGLPAATHCPLCNKGVVRVYRDALVGGQWFHCQTCGRQGDMIELAAAVWELGIPDTVSRLRRLGFDLPDSESDIRHYIQDQVEYRQRLHKLWDSAHGHIDTNRERLDWRITLASITRYLNRVARRARKELCGSVTRPRLSVVSHQAR